MSLTGRALKPYPPVVVGFDGDLRPASIVNTDPVEVEWKKRDRRKSTISFPTDADEAVESGTEYVVRYGPPGLETETVVGDDTDTTGTFVIDFKGYNRIEFFARFGGEESTVFAFDTVAENGDGLSVLAIMPGPVVVSPIQGAVTVQLSVPLPGPIVVTLSEPLGVEITDMPTVTVTPIEGVASITAVGDIGQVSLIAVEAEASGEVDVEAAIGSIVVEEVEAEAEGEASAYKSLLFASHWSGLPISAASTTNYLAPITGLRLRATEAQAEIVFPVACTIRNFSAHVIGNARTTNTTYKVRVEGADGGPQIVYGSGETGRKRDSMNEASVAAGEKVCISVTTLTGSQTLTLTSLQIEVETDDGKACMVYYYTAPGNVSRAGNSKLYSRFSIYARSTIIGWETPSLRGYRSTRQDFRAAGTLSDFRVMIGANTANIDTKFNVLLNGNSTPVMSVTIPAGSGAGIFDDVSSTVTIAPGDYVEIEWDMTGVGSGGTTLISIQSFFLSDDGSFDISGSLYEDDDPASDGNTGTEYTNLGGIVYSAASMSEANRGIIMTFPAELKDFGGHLVNSGVTNTTMTVRVNGSDTSLVIARNVNSDDFHMDTTHTETVALDDIITVKKFTTAGINGPYNLQVNVKSTG